MVDRRCRESEGKVKIKGYMSVSDEEAHQCHLVHLIFFSSRPPTPSRPPRFLLQQTTHSTLSISFPSHFLQQQTTDAVSSISFSLAADHQLHLLSILFSSAANHQLHLVHLVSFSSRSPMSSRPSRFLQQQTTDSISSISFPSRFLQQQTTDTVSSISFPLAADHRLHLVSILFPSAADHRLHLVHLIFFSSRPLTPSRPPRFLLQQTTDSISSISFPSHFLQQQTIDAVSSISFSSAADHRRRLVRLLFFSSRPPDRKSTRLNSSHI